jgi:hypothetical protein
MIESLGERFWFGIAGAISLVLAVSIVMLWMARWALLRANESLRRSEMYLAEAQKLSHVGQLGVSRRHFNAVTGTGS